jgi:hypothetical protein
VARVPYAHQLLKRAGFLDLSHPLLRLSLVTSPRKQACPLRQKASFHVNIERQLGKIPISQRQVERSQLRDGSTHWSLLLGTAP